MKRYHHLTQRDRYLVEDLLSLGKSKAAIARELGLHRATIGRELKRNGNRKGGYKARGAQSIAWSRRRTPWDAKRKIKGLLEQVILEKLAQRWSPEQISGRLKLEGKWSVSHETIYQWIYKIAPDCKSALRLRGRQRRGRRRVRKPFQHPVRRKRLEKRPREANERGDVGHWERDLLEGKRGRAALLVITDRKSRFTLLRKVRNKMAKKIAAATRDSLSGHRLKTVTNDNGVEFGNPDLQEGTLNAPVFYTDPYTSWQRGTVENTNGLLRQFFPKKTNFDNESFGDLSFVERLLNGRPRKMFGYRTSREEHFSLSEKLIASNYALRKRMYERFERDLKQSLISAGVALTP